MGDAGDTIWWGKDEKMNKSVMCVEMQTVATESF